MKYESSPKKAFLKPKMQFLGEKDKKRPFPQLYTDSIGNCLGNQKNINEFYRKLP